MIDDVPGEGITTDELSHLFRQVAQHPAQNELVVERVIDRLTARWSTLRRTILRETYKRILSTVLKVREEQRIAQGALDGDEDDQDMSAAALLARLGIPDPEPWEDAVNSVQPVRKCRQ